VQREAEEGLTAADVHDALRKGFELVEDYPDDPRGHSCLLLSWIGETPIHVVCAPHKDVLIVVTIYIPSESEWGPDYKTRRGLK
jgi:hypothetical protein